MAAAYPIGSRNVESQSRAKSLAWTRELVTAALAVTCLTAAGCQARPELPVAAGASTALPDRARELAHKFIVLDGHVDLPYWLEESRDRDGTIVEDISRRARGDFDWERAQEGGLSAPFMSIYVPSKFDNGGAKSLADRLIDMVTGFSRKWPDKFALARSPSEVRANFAAGKMSLPMGMENGSPLEHDITNVRYFYDRGVRYITLTHAKANQISDSSYDQRRTHHGLSSFGKEVVAEMNRLGMMIDVAHVSDDAFWQVMSLSRAPVIASHSSCRHYTPGFERNMSDEMIRMLAKHGGVIQINFASPFIDAEAQRQQEAMRMREQAALAEKGLDADDPEAKPILARMRAAHPAKFATVEQVADHIDHVRELVGIEYVGLGSDFDGVGDSLPSGLKDVSQYPNLIHVLLERGYTEQEIEKVCSANVLRVWQAVEDYARAPPPRWSQQVAKP